MIPEPRSNTSNPPDGARPSLGSSVKDVIAGWYRAVTTCESTSQIVRAHALLSDEKREYCWEQAAIYRVLPGGERRPATAIDLETLARAISYGWFLVYRLAAPGQEPVVLHQTGLLVPFLPLRAEDLPDLLREPETPPAPQAVPDTAGSSPHGEKDSVQKTRRWFLLAVAVAESALLLCLLLTRRVIFALAMAALLALLLAVDRLRRRSKRYPAR